MGGLESVRGLTLIQRILDAEDTVQWVRDPAGGSFSLQRESGLGEDDRPLLASILASFATPFTSARFYGDSLAGTMVFRRTEEIDGTVTHVLAFPGVGLSFLADGSRTDAAETTIWIGAEDYLVRRVDVEVTRPEQGGTRTGSARFADFREVDGLMHPFVVELERTAPDEAATAELERETAELDALAAELELAKARLQELSESQRARAQPLIERTEAELQSRRILVELVREMGSTGSFTVETLELRVDRP
jgi:hypothetical protein